MPITKEFQTVQDRISILETRRLKFKNKERAKQTLKNIIILMSSTALKAFF